MYKIDEILPVVYEPLNKGGDGVIRIPVKVQAAEVASDVVCPRAAHMGGPKSHKAAHQSSLISLFFCHVACIILYEITRDQTAHAVRNHVHPAGGDALPVHVLETGLDLLQETAFVLCHDILGSIVTRVFQASRVSCRYCFELCEKGVNIGFQTEHFRITVQPMQQNEGRPAEAYAPCIPALLENGEAIFLVLTGFKLDVHLGVILELGDKPLRCDKHCCALIDPLAAVHQHGGNPQRQISPTIDCPLYPVQRLQREGTDVDLVDIVLQREGDISGRKRRRDQHKTCVSIRRKPILSCCGIGFSVYGVNALLRQRRAVVVIVAIFIKTGDHAGKIKTIL